MSSCECGKLPNSFPTVTAKRYKMRRNKAKWLRACYILRQSARIHLGMWPRVVYSYITLYSSWFICMSCCCFDSTRLPPSSPIRCPSAIICLARMRLLVLAHNKIIYCIINNTGVLVIISPFPPARLKLLFNFDLHSVPSIKSQSAPAPLPQLPRCANKGNKINKIKIKIYKSVAAMLQQCVCAT